MTDALKRALVAIATASLGLALVCAWGWYRSARTRVALESLSPEERQSLAEEMLAASPGAFVPALFEPAVGYTLRRRGTIEAWGDSFAANEIGYRTGPLPGRKARQGPFRVVFLGDSWTFGMGVREEESFPARFAELANQRAGRRVEVFNLGLPGYNTLNEIAALEFFYDRLSPDAVVICPTSNDADSTANILPNGSLTRMGVERDVFGDDHSLLFPRLVDSYKFRSRWRRSFDAIRALEERLRSRGVPLMIYFTATWDEPFAHELVRASGVTAPYLITPRRLATPRWRNPAPWFHGTPEANRLYGHMIYKGMAEMLGWPAPPPEEETADVPLFRRPPGDGGAETLLAEATERIPERYTPGRAALAAYQCVGPTDCRSGLTGKATTVLVRRRAGAERIEVALRRLPNAPSILPLPVRVSIPSASGGTEIAGVLSASGPDPLIIRVPIPGDVRVGAAMDVTIRAGRAVSAPVVLAPRSLFITAIEQN